MADPIIATLIFVLLLVIVPILVISVYLMGGICIVFFTIIRKIKKTIKKCKNQIFPKAY
jgi:Flp pilus assembly protein TadB